MSERQSGYRLPELSEHLLESKIVPQTFRIKVFQPIMCVDGSERFPVLYATDGDKLFDALAAMAKEMQLFGEVERFILVGIGYENSRAADALRMRDLFTHEVRDRLIHVINLLMNSPLVQGVEDIRTITETTDAREFLSFIRTELKPFIESRYPVSSGNNGFTGFSAGGTFGLYALFSEPGTFNRYILNSPGTSFNGHHFGIELVRPFLDSARSMEARVFMSAGELEEFYAQFNLTSGYCRLAKYLKDASIPGLDLRFKLLPDELHSTVWASSFGHGVRTLFTLQGQNTYRIDFNVKS